MRHAGPWRQLTVDTSAAIDMADVLARFHAGHARAYAFSDPARPVEVHAARLVALGAVPKPPDAPPGVSGTLPAEPGVRRVFFAETTACATPRATR